MRILVIGATGLLGRVLLEEWKEDTVRGVGSHDLDIRDEQRSKQYLRQYHPDWTVLLAAYTDVDGCEADPIRTRQVNCEGAIHVARAAADVGSRLLFLSSDYVFSGLKTTPYETTDETCPINVYGQSKADAEKSVRAIVPDCCIVRTSWLFGVLGRCFPNTILELAKRDRKLRVVDDQIGSPTYNRDLAKVIVELVRSNAQGIYHASNAGETSWFDFARELVSVSGLKDVSIEAIDTEDMPRPARRPKYSALSNTSLEKHGIQMRPWQTAVLDYTVERAKASNPAAEVVVPGAKLLKPREAGKHS
jgi:dTDP-4-dehydrorhamnose reductase